MNFYLLFLCCQLEFKIKQLYFPLQNHAYSRVDELLNSNKPYSLHRHPQHFLFQYFLVSLLFLDHYQQLSALLLLSFRPPFSLLKLYQANFYQYQPLMLIYRILAACPISYLIILDEVVWMYWLVMAIFHGEVERGIIGRIKDDCHNDSNLVICQHTAIYFVNSATFTRAFELLTIYQTILANRVTYPRVGYYRLLFIPFPILKTDKRYR